MEKIKKLIPEPVKRFLIKVHYIPEKIFLKIYRLASQGKIFVPDKIFQKWDYKIHCGKKLSFKNPQTFTEKLQWMKYYYHNPEYTKLVDKFEVRKYVSEKIGEEYLVPIYGVYNSWDEINFDELPDKFVIKCTHDSGSVVICTDKSKFDFDAAKAKINSGLVHNHFYKSREWPYKNVKPRIIIEKHLIGDEGFGLVDYKCFSFSGKVKFILTCSNRFMNGGMRVSFYDTNWNKLDLGQIGEENETRLIKEPELFDKILAFSEILSENIPHVRVDFIISENKLYFTELTFFDSGGRKPFLPESFEKQCGDWITLPPKMR